VGDIITQRVAIEDGAYFKGKVDIQKDGAKPEARGPVASASGAAAGASAVASKTPVTEAK
jgi:cytoskeletal protein CcmA (bactofilin family)